MHEIVLKDLKVLDIPFSYGTSYGARQEWYGTNWKRRAGCGPTTAANIMIYNSKTKQSQEKLFDSDINFQNSIKIMNEMWEYVTPTRMGVNKTSILGEGVVSFAQKKGISLDAQILEVPLSKCQRASTKELADYLSNCLKKDEPVAFLNLHSGQAKNLYSWHWTLIVGVKVFEDKVIGIIYDEGKYKEANLSLWNKTSLVGGGFVSFIQK